MPKRVEFKGYKFVLYEKSVGMEGVYFVYYLDRKPQESDLEFLAQVADSFYRKGCCDTRREIQGVASQLYAEIFG